MFCKKCGFENKDNEVFCQQCGEEIRLDGNKKGFLKLINLKVIIMGFLILLVLISTVSFLGADLEGIIFATIFLLVIVVFGIITGFLSGKEYSSGIFNVLLVFACFGILFAGVYGIIVLIWFLLLFPVPGLIGAIIGVFICRKIKS